MPVPRAPDTLVDFHTERDHRVRPSVYASLSCRTCAPRCGRRRDPSLQSPAVPCLLRYGVIPTKGLWSARAGIDGFLSLPLLCVSRWPWQARQPAGYGRGAGDGNCSATFGSIQVGPSSQGATLGAYRHRLRLFLPMRRTRVSGRPGLRMPRGANLAKKNRGGGLFRSGLRVQRTRLVSKDRDM